MRTIFFLLASCLFLQACNQTTLYVAPEGSGEKFSRSKPGSLIDAQNEVRILTGEMTGDITVMLLKGQYSLDAPIKLGPEDSGQNGFRVIYRAEKSGSVNISGGTLLSGWTEENNGIFRAAYNGPGFRQLYINGERAIRARIPNRSNEQTYGPYYRTMDWDAETRRISVRSEDFSDWEGLCEMELVIKKHWGQNRMRPDHFEIRGEETWLFFREPESSSDPWTKGCCPGFDDSQTYYFENSLDLLDVPGEWFLDREANEVWYMPRPGEDMSRAEVIVPVLETLVEMDGASHITFEGLVFEHSNWDLPDSARNGIQAGWRRQYSRGFIPGGIQAVRAHHLRFSGNIIRHFGGAGIEFLHSTHDNVIKGNLITDISANGIQININTENRSPSADEACRNDSIIHNYVIKTACEYTGNTGILATYVNNMVIEHNEVADLPYTGISIGWGWTDSITGLHDNMIRYNDIHHVGQLHDDGGCIYNLSKSEGSLIAENYAHDMRKSEWTGNFTYGGIYLDNGSSAIMIENNVLENVEVYPMVAWNPPNHSNTFRNNYYTDMGKLHIREGNTVENNLAVKGDNWPEEARRIMEAAGPKIPMPLSK